MKWLQGLSTRARLLWAFGTVVVLSALLGLFSLMQLGKVQDSVEAIGNNWLPSVRVAAEVDKAVATYRRRQLNHVLSSDPAQMRKLENELRDFEPDVARRFDQYEKMIVLPEERELLDRIKSGWRDYLVDSAQVVQLSSSGKQEAAEAQMQGSSLRKYEAISADVDRLVALNVRGADQARSAAETVYRDAVVLTIAIIAVVLVAGVVLALLITRALMRELGGEPAYARQMLQRVAAGELDVRIEVAAHDSSSLIAELAKMVASLNGIVQTIRRASDSIGTASTQIAAGNADLSSRTEEQASNLQQTAASMEQFTGSVKANADSAREAATLATGAADVATRGGAIVGEVVNTMSQIQESSRRIAEIITVIDGIAFQTNILALNAAVEAARAGEQGRGFAVVAGEVRALAQRAGQAAREIKTLISDSTEKVDAGGRQVQSAGSTIDELVQQVGRVSSLISEITAATLEQSTGINQVNEAVTQLDTVTQQNAALVEESAAATESLRSQAQGLAQAVSVFRTAAMA